MNACSAFVFVAVAALMITGGNAFRRHCLCDLRWSTSELQAGESADNLPVLKGLRSTPYKGWLGVACKRVLKACPDDCKNEVHDWLGGPMFNELSGQFGCENVRRNAPPTSPIYVYASHKPSTCDGRSWQYVAPLCCWEISFPGYDSIYLYNHRCQDDCPPTGC